MTRHRRPATFAAVTGAVLGLGAALRIAPLLPFRAPADQLPGYAAMLGFDPRYGALRLLLLVLLSVVGGAVGWRITRPGAQPCLGGASAPARIPPIACRHVAGSHTRILVPAVAAHALSAWIFLIVPFGSRGARPFVLYVVLLSLAFALAAALGAGNPEKGAGYLGAASAILPFSLLGPRPVTLWLAVGLAAYALPVLARLGAATRPGAARVSRALVVALLVPGSVTALAAAASMRTPRIASVFEDGHALLPASEYMRGELPYRDIVPGHGLVSDGLLALAELRLFGDDYAGLKRGEKVSGAFFWPAFYAVGYAATGSAAVASGGLLLSFLLAPQYQLFRATASLWTLALAIYASRTRKPRAWLACGIALPLSFCVAVEFAVYQAAEKVGFGLTWICLGCTL